MLCFFAPIRTYGALEIPATYRPTTTGFRQHFVGRKPIDTYAINILWWQKTLQHEKKTSLQHVDYMTVRGWTIVYKNRAALGLR